jgi:hypothetical protein
VAAQPRAARPERKSAGNIGQLARFPNRKDASMTDNIYKVIELVGSSETSIEDAVSKAIERASATIREIRWFEVVSTRGHVEEGRVAHFQVTLKVGFTLHG